MRLLLRSEIGKFSFTKDLVGDDPIPHYAILSHTWGPDNEEVTFEDIINGTGEKKLGYEKIRFCGEQARQDELQYFWIDTCCINKNNPIELSHAINSMFQWYRNATRCYVYLSDVSFPPIDSNDKYVAQLGDLTFRKSRWFTWIWTLQELIAPASIEFSHIITSTFRWYYNAIPYNVYSSGVSIPPRNSNREYNTRPWEPAFRNSKWFTRGWTLQELLAPASVEFFSRERKCLGDRSSLKQQIHQITSLPQSALEGTLLSQFTVDERYMWMECRQTKLPEDKVYSLLGIFDVKMPLYYDEGAASASKRLRDVIDKRKKCMQDLNITDPRKDKKRIEATKGGLLEGAYHWILDHPDFRQWRDDQQGRLLWVKGDPGKGKTMLLCGIIDELKKSKVKANLSYFFCQATDSRINNATAVLRGLMYLLIDKQPSLISHMQEKHDHAGKTLFEDANAWVTLSEIFTNILQDPSLNSTFLIVDALDECVTDLPILLDFIREKSSVSSCIKWLVSSRNRPDIEERLRLYKEQRLSLELNAKQVSHAVELFIKYKVSRLTKIEDDSTLQEQVRNQMQQKADGTFLWVALVFQELEMVESWNVLRVLGEMPKDLQELYGRMMGQIQQLKHDDPKFCRLVLSTTTLVLRPLHILELGILSGLPEGISDNLDRIAKIVSMCGSFLTIQGDNYVNFIHQSAKDYLDSDESRAILPSWRCVSQYDLFSRSLQAMSQTLQEDIYGLRLPGISIDLAQAQAPNPDPLAPLQYSCTYWASHFEEACKGNSSYQYDLTDDGDIYRFLHNNFLFWLEALSLIRQIPMGVLAIQSLSSSLVSYFI
jgi:hypothetical protein